MKNLLKTSLILLPEIIFKKNENLLFIVNKTNYDFLDIKINSFFLLNTLKQKIQKTIIGNKIAFIQRLVIKGVGFRIEKYSNNLLKLKLGFSHELFIQIPKEIEIFLSKKNIIVCKSFNYDVLMLFVAQLQKLKKIDKYKGKGLFKKNITYILKEGKKKKK